jgi:hypothetical protein
MADELSPHAEQFLKTAGSKFLNNWKLIFSKSLKILFSTSGNK